MGLGGKQPRFPGKTPRFPGKQPRRTIEPDSEEDEADGARSAEEAKEDVLDSDEDVQMQIDDEEDEEDADYEEEEREETDRYGFLKGTDFTKAPSHFDGKIIEDLLLLLPRRDRESVEALKGIKREERIEKIHENYVEAYEYHRNRRMREAAEAHNREKQQARKPRSQKQKEKKKEALQQLMEEKRSLAQKQSRMSRDLDEDYEEDGDASADDEDGLDDDEDYEDGGSRSRPSKRKRGKRAGRDSDSPDDLEAQIMAALDSDEDEQDMRARMPVAPADEYEEDEDSEPATYEEINKARLARAFLGKHLHEPYFLEMIKDAFVRIPVGTSNGRNIYRMARVHGVEEYKRFYTIDLDGNGKTMQTNKQLVVYLDKDGFGKLRTFDIARISNHKFTKAEYAVYEETVRNAGGEFPRATEVRRITERMRTLPMNYTYKASDVQEIALSRGLEKAGQSSMRKINEIEKELNTLRGELRMKRDLLERAEEAARASNADDLGPAPAEEENLERAKKAYEAIKTRVVVARKRHQAMVQSEQNRAERAVKQGDGMDKINKRNELDNVKTILQSGERKRRAARAAMDGGPPSKRFGSNGAATAEPMRRGASGGARKSSFDPFKRRLTRPTILWATKKESAAQEKEERQADAPVEEKASPVRAVQPAKAQEPSPAKPRSADLEMLMCAVLTPDPVSAEQLEGADQARGDSALRLAASELRLPWPLPIVDPAHRVDEKDATVQPSSFLLSELAHAERYLLGQGRRYRAVKMHLNMHRWREALELARGGDPRLVDLVLARRLAFLEGSNASESLPAFRHLSSKAAQLDFDALKAATQQFDQEDADIWRRLRGGDGEVGQALVYTLDEYHARRDEQE
uniref:Plus3 domain-containing protein n=1 Tax=Pinguiococcus pyrenoidosus TaxID=172671 RepID=A0A7R9Y8J2_9STRA|mmetsp:Transcript_12695/g.46889  ORF Transcript_12695/g.46889 Transcript_12695/m.46889 type:complete len:863 (+) Transcript_12695:77-2665(+)